MTKSTEIKNLAAAFCKFQAELEAVKKEAQNPFYNSQYASLDSIIESVRKPLEKHGLAFLQFPSGENQLTTILLHTSGEWIEDTYMMRPIDQKPQSVGSAITYMRRYALGAVLGIATEEDDDGAGGQKKPAARAKTAPPATAAAAPAKPTATPVTEKTTAVCEQCLNPVTAKVQQYSMGRFKKTLCFDCQKLN